MSQWYPAIDGAIGGTADAISNGGDFLLGGIGSTINGIIGGAGDAAGGLLGGIFGPLGGWMVKMAAVLVGGYVLLNAI